MENDMFGLGLPELLVILVIVLVLFGPKRLKNIGSDLGNAIKGFRSAVKEEEQTPDTPQSRVIEGEVDRADAGAAKAKKQDTNV
jgi:sec-independent protein translocase protein TatA